MVLFYLTLCSADITFLVGNTQEGLQKYEHVYKKDFKSISFKPAASAIR